MKLTPHSWYVDTDGRLVQVEKVLATHTPGLIPDTVTATRIDREGETSWLTASMDAEGWKEASPEDVVARLKIAQKWVHDRPTAVLRNGVQWQSNAGVDPEIFLEDSKGKLIEAFRVLPDKEHAIRFHGDEHILLADLRAYWDGFQAEMSVSPHYCHAKLVDYIQGGLEGILGHVRKTHPDAQYSFKTVVEIPKDVLENEPMAHVQLGCEPSENVYGMCGMHVEAPRELKWRFAGGHYHFDPLNWKGQLAPAVISRMVKAADMVAAVPCVAMFQKYDSPVRRVYYGLAGEHRVPKHGVEYRVLSNAWLFHPAVAHFSLELVRAGLKLGFRDLAGCFDYDEDAVVRIILDGDVDGAKKHVQKNARVYEWLFGPIVERGLAEYRMGSEHANKILKASVAQLQEPINNFAPMESISTNWHLFTNAWESQSRGKGAQWQRLILGK